jgi:hypothetical protein
MKMFNTESDLLTAVSHHDDLVRQCVAGYLSFEQFLEKYDDFYWAHALDGHESDDEERALLTKHEDRIRPHRIIAEEILGQVCSNEDAQREIYREAGRFGPAEAVVRLGRIEFLSA